MMLLLVNVSCSFLTENWELVEVVTKGEDTEVVREVVQVRYCTSSAEEKMVECSAGTSSDLTYGLSVQGGVTMGAIVASVGPEVATSLGFNRNSGETLRLNPPPIAGLIYHYPIEKSYHIFTGQILAESSLGNTNLLQYQFNASCSLQKGEPKVTTCDNIPVENSSISPNTASMPASLEPQSGEQVQATSESSPEATIPSTVLTEEAPLISLIAADVLIQIQRLGYSTAADFAEAWSLRFGADKANGEIEPSEIVICPGELNGCVRIAREKNASGTVEWAFFARNPTNCKQDGYRREPGVGGQTGVPPKFEGLLEGVTIRRCLETNTSEILPEEDQIESSAPDNLFADWVVCWHGRSGYELLIAYSEVEARNGIDLAGKVTRKPWDGQDEDLANDSLKMCYYRGEWYGSPNPPWFPSVSYMQLQEDKFLVCEHSPGCGGNQWQLLPGASSPMQINDLVTEPPQTGIQLLTYWAS